MSTKTVSSGARVKVLESQEVMRSGGEMRPLEYPHLYQIQAGEWRISYAVEHNRLAILVLEVLTPEGVPSEDPVHEKIARKMKIKLLDWPEDAPGAQLTPEELGKKLKIKLLDMAPELAKEEGSSEGAARASKVRLHPSSAKASGQRTVEAQAGSKRKIKLRDGSPPPAREDTVPIEGKVTPLDSPTM